MTSKKAGEIDANPDRAEQAMEGFLLILGSGPSVAALEGLLMANQAGGVMYHNAVENQQMTNILGMAMTAKCIRYMLDPKVHPVDVDEPDPAG